ncbi:YetF domain-containing protein [Paenisporosarcina macmurdoensis]|uniref:YetF domain-containing protein n=1 Tax=Paenisporosarcina macmurdoensis TaxID=212659 RepID=A0ABW1L626_9BACL
MENGTINDANLKKLRLTVDKLEARLRQSGIAAINDVQFATIETSGQIGYTLKKEKQPATKEDIQNLIQLIQKGYLTDLTNKTSPEENIFTETVNKNSSNTPNHLQ